MELDFNIRHLRYFYDAAKSNSVALAAEKNFVTHATVSLGIKKLEQSLSMSLLHHEKRKFRLTEDGQHLLQECEKIFLSLKNFEHHVGATQKISKGMLKFASSHSLVSAFVLKTIVQMKEKHPLIESSFKLGKTALIKEWVLKREVDFGISIDDGKLNDVEKIIISEGKFVVAKSIDFTHSNDFYIMTESRPETEYFKKIYKEKFKKDLQILALVESWELITQMVELGFGAGLIPDFILSESRKKNLILSRLGISIPYQIVLIHRKGEGLSRQAQIFLKILKAQF